MVGLNSIGIPVESGGAALGVCGGSSLPTMDLPDPTFFPNGDAEPTLPGLLALYI